MTAEPIVVILGGHVTALGLVRALRSHPVQIEVWDKTPRSLCRFSRHISAFKVLDVHADEVIDELLERAQLCAGAAHVVATDDLTTATISKNHATIASAGIKPWIDTWDKVERFYDKRSTYELAASLGVAHPTYVAATSVSQVEAQIAYPVVLKPSAMEAFNQQHRCKGIICTNRGMLVAGLERFAPQDASYALLAQEYVPGDAGGQYSLALLRGADGSVRGLAARRKRQLPKGVGTATFVETCDAGPLLDPARALLDAIDYRGVCEVEFKYDARTGELKLLEVNPRFFKWNALLTAAGVDFIAPLLNPDGLVHEVDVRGGELDIGWQDSIADIVAIATEAVYLRRPRILWKDFGKKRVDAVLDARDRRPFFRYLRFLPRLARGGRSAL